MLLRRTGHDATTHSQNAVLSHGPQRADTLRARALELVTLLSHLQLFAHLPDGDSAFSGGQLPPLFREDSKLAEAAVGAAGPQQRCSLLQRRNKAC